MDLAKRRRARAHKRNDNYMCPYGILDVIQADYPEKYAVISKNHNLIKTLFSEDEWREILIKSRNSYESHIVDKVRPRDK